MYVFLGEVYGTGKEIHQTAQITKIFLGKARVFLVKDV
jgi:hypothetical protein